jgi:hypothetical protein
LILIVIFAGLLLGSVLAHFFGGARTSPKATPVSVAAAVVPSASPALFPPALPRPSRTPRTPVASPSPASSPAPTAAVSTSPSPSPSPKPSISASPASPKATSSPAKTVAAATKAPLLRLPVVTASPAPPIRAAAAASPVPNYVSSGSDHAAEIVRSYLGAIARGDRATATTYLARGLPGEVFMDSSARVVSLHSSAAGGEQYKVTADVQTSTGEYYVTFAVEPGSGGLQITDHYAIKVR